MAKLGPIPDLDEEFAYKYNAFRNLPEPFLFATLRGWADDIAQYYEARDYARAIRQIMELADLVNAYVDELKPWVLVKEDKLAELNAVCVVLLNAFKLLTLYIKPVLPTLAAEAETFLNIPPQSWADVDSPLLPGHRINDYKHLMTRLDPKQVEALVAANKESLAPTAPAPAPIPAKAAESPQRHGEHQQHGVKVSEPHPSPLPSPLKGEGASGVLSGGPLSPEISIDDFSKVDLRIARIVNAEHVEGAAKLLKLTLDIGEEKPRQVFAGIKSAYDPATLVGRMTVMVANLAPRKMKFGMSEGMVLAASGDGPGLFILSPDAGAQPGMRVK
jgi:methionyl-tRNA synthetase